MSNGPVIRQTYYVSTGALHAMFTLRMTRRVDGGDADVNRFVPDNHICNLAAAGEENAERACEKAKAYCDAMRERIGERDDFFVEFGGIWGEATTHRRGKLSVRQTQFIEEIEAGRLPFGKHRGLNIVDAPASYLLFFADKAGQEANDVVMAALTAACQGAALEMGYIAKREQARADRAEADAKSDFIGDVDERREFEGEIITSFFKPYDPCSAHEVATAMGFFINKVRVGDDIVAYIGARKLGEKGETVRFSARITAHDTYNGVRSTKVNRPTKIEIVATVGAAA